ncbi:MAG: hypothetical protein QNI84_02885 [Henriciella sp.]|nr:hypothetical protein [Henriciella sp.]
MFVFDNSVVESERGSVDTERFRATVKLTLFAMTTANHTTANQEPLTGLVEPTIRIDFSELIEYERVAGAVEAVDLAGGLSA